jgi:exodeoxyribonuclease VII large subunit
MSRPAGIPGSTLTGPWPVGHYAAALRERLRGFTRVQVFGEVFGFKAGRAKVWFELRDAGGALPCSMWREDFEALGMGALADGVQVVAAGGCDYYPGSRTASPGFSFAVTGLRVAGEGDLLAQLAQLRRRLAAEGLFAPQKALPRPALPRCIGVVTGEAGKARDDVLAGLRRRGWAGRVVWAFAPVQDRHAAPAVTRALQDLVVAGVDVIVVARGGGSLADLFAFCDETLCRTVALLPVPVIASLGHHTDRTLMDDVAAVSCSTPTHAAEAAVPVDCAAARSSLHALAARLERQGRRAVVDRARELARLSRAPAHHVERHRTRLHQLLRELRASSRRALAAGERETAVGATALAQRAAAPRAIAEGRRSAAAHAAALARRSRAASGLGVRARDDVRLAAAAVARAATVAPRRRQLDVPVATLARAANLQPRRRELARLSATLAAHDPQRTLERGYALVEDPAGEPVTSASTARAAPRLVLRLSDGRVAVRPDPAAP